MIQEDPYLEFLKRKIPQAERAGFEPKSKPHGSLFPHQVDIAIWAIRGGRRAIFANFGLGKTRMHLQIALWVAEYTGGRYLIVAPLGVRQEFTKSDGPAMGVEVEYVRTDAEVAASTAQILITNYERVRDGDIDVSKFDGAGLDESSVLRSFGSKTYQEFLGKFKSVRYRFVFTATPSPNRYKELIHYGGFLGVMDTGEALTRFFQRNSEKANDLTLYPHMERQFWMWLSSWAVFIQRPSDLGYPDAGYDLPPLKVFWHKLDTDHTRAWSQTDSWGQAQLLRDDAQGLQGSTELKRESISQRVAKACEIITEGGEERHWLLWHDLEKEREAIEDALPDAVTVYGSQDLELREERIMGFARGEYRILATKPILAGSGCNFQKHCSDAIFLGVGYKFNDFIQAIHRVHRFLQAQEVTIHIIYLDSESTIMEALKAKWRRHDELMFRMSEILRVNRLTNTDTMQLVRSLGCDRSEVRGDRFHVAHNDCVLEMRETEENSIDFICTSIPFGNQYEYSPSFNDFGHNTGDTPFFEQMGFLVPELLRVLKPGRIAAIHVKDRIMFGNVTGLACPTVNPFSDKTTAAFTKEGFLLMARITIDTDVVRENNQTYRLGWSENAKDSSKMGAGMPEYVLVFRKLPSDLSNAYADTRVAKSKEDYTRADWQIDAAGLWRSNGNRLPDPEILRSMSHEDILRLWRKHSVSGGYSHETHVEIAKALEEMGKLPSSFMLFPPISRNMDIWTDIARMRTLNSEQSRRNLEQHVCPLQLDIIKRLITRYTNHGELVFDPFMGIGSVPYQALMMGRRGAGVELNVEYWRCAVGYCEMAEAEVGAPTLFDLMTPAA
jgi:DNA modification methylase